MGISALVILAMVIGFLILRICRRVIDSHYETKRQMRASALNAIRQNREAALMQRLSEEETKRWKILANALRLPRSDETQYLLPHHQARVQDQAGENDDHSGIKSVLKRRIQEGSSAGVKRPYHARL